MNIPSVLFDVTNYTLAFEPEPVVKGTYKVTATKKGEPPSTFRFIRKELWEMVMFFRDRVDPNYMTEGVNLLDDLCLACYAEGSEEEARSRDENA